IAAAPDQIALEAVLRLARGERRVRGRGADAIAAFADALAREAGLAVEVRDSVQHAAGEGPRAGTVVYVEARVRSGPVRYRAARPWGVWAGTPTTSPPAPAPS